MKVKFYRLLLSVVVPCIIHADIVSVGDHLITDGSWLSRGGETMSQTESATWNKAGFNSDNPQWANLWTSAYEDYPLSPLVNLDDCIPGTTAEPIWYYPQGTPNGTNGDPSAYFRKEFTLEVPEGYASAACILQMVIDDDCVVYLDGNPILVDDDNMGSTYSFSDLGYYNRKDPLMFTIESGEHVLAIHAADGYLLSPHDYLYEVLAVDAYFTVATPVPEPSCLLLMLMGLSMVGATARNRAKKSKGASLMM